MKNKLKIQKRALLITIRYLNEVKHSLEKTNLNDENIKNILRNK